MFGSFWGMPKTPGGMTIYPNLRIRRGAFFFSAFTENTEENPLTRPLTSCWRECAKTRKIWLPFFRYIKPDAGLKEFETFLAGHLKSVQVADNILPELFERLGPHAYSLVDLGYITRVHPLELWTLAYLNQHPDATQGEVIKISAAERQEVYTWLF